MVEHTGFCPDCMKVTPHTNNECNLCARERGKEEQERWKSLTLEQRIEELKQRIDLIELRGRPLG